MGMIKLGFCQLVRNLVLGMGSGKLCQVYSILGLEPLRLYTVNIYMFLEAIVRRMRGLGLFSLIMKEMLGGGNCRINYMKDCKGS